MAHDGITLRSEIRVLDELDYGGMHWVCAEPTPAARQSVVNRQRAVRFDVVSQQLGPLPTRPVWLAVTGQSYIRQQA